MIIPKIERKRAAKLSIEFAFDRIPDVIIATAVALIFGGGVEAIVIIFFVLQFLYLAIWLRNSAWSWAKFKARDKKPMVLNALAVLGENDFPRPDKINPRAEDYFRWVMVDDTLPIQTRLQAARQIGVFDYLVENLRAQEYVRLSYILDEAVRRHSR